MKDTRRTLRDISRAVESCMEVMQLLCVAVDMIALAVILQGLLTTKEMLKNLAWRCRDLGHLAVKLHLSLEYKKK